MLPVAQVASVVGVYGLSALVALVSAAARVRARSSRVAATLARRRAVGRCSSLARPASGAALRIASHPLTTAGTPIRVAVLQGNILQDQKWDPAMRDAIMQRYIDMTREAIGRNAQFILWPESATPLPLRGGRRARRDDPPAGARGARHAAHRQRSGRAGATAAPAEAADGAVYNAAYLIQPDGTTGAVYRKIHLVPFGEYVPFKRCCSSSARSSRRSPISRRAPRRSLLPVAGHLASTAICYEVIYSSLIRVVRDRTAASC